MKAEISKFITGLSGEGHTPYRLQLIPENEEEKALTRELNTNYVVWVSPNIRDKDAVVSWWGKT